MKLLLNSGAELVIDLVDSPLVHDWAQRLCELPLDETEVSGFDNRKVEWNFDKFKSLFHVLHNKLIRYQAGADYWSKIKDLLTRISKIELSDDAPIITQRIFTITTRKRIIRCRFLQLLL